MSAAPVRTQLDGALLRVTLDRPAKKNALTQAMYTELAGALARAEKDRAIHVVVLDASGDAFSAGNDLDDFPTRPAGEGARPPVTHFLRALATATVPLVIAVQGAAIGVGTTMLLHADLVYAASDARFRLPFLDLGLVPEAGSTLLLPQLIGHRRAAELLYTGRFFGAEEARRLGLVNAVVERGRLAEVTTEAALELAGKPPEALRRTKALLRGPTETITERIALESRVFAERLASAEFADAQAAFFARSGGR